MTRYYLCLAAASIVLAGCISIHGTKRIEEKTAASKTAPSAKKPVQVLRHVVMLKFKDGISNQQIRQVENDFCALPSKVDTVYDFEWGTDVSVENLSGGFTHCFVVTFRSEADRAKYLPHPAHKQFADSLGLYIDKVLVVDYWTKQ